jgi:hypothetical protein
LIAHSGVQRQTAVLSRFCVKRSHSINLVTNSNDRI